MNPEDRGPWYLLTGLILGVALGILYTWMVHPVRYVNTSPVSLQPAYKDRYRAMIAAAYMANNDLVRARARLALLSDVDMYRALAEQAQRTLAEGRSPDEARALGLLAVALGQPPATAQAATGVPVTASPSPPLASPSITAEAATDTPAVPASPEAALASPLPATTGPAPTTASPTLGATPTRLPTRTPTLTPGAPFVLESQELTCDMDRSEPVVQVLAEDSAGQPVPGVEVVISWQGGEEHFWTGLKPEQGLGYADFTLSPGVAYTLRLAEGGQPVQNLTADECERQTGIRTWGAWRLVFRQP